MKIFTSYFAKYKGNRGISIARYASWYNGRTIIALAPDAETLQKYTMAIKFVRDGIITLDVEQFLEEARKIYTQQYLETLKSKEAKEAILKLKDGDVLLCYEKTGKFCHRHILAEELRKLGYEVEEL